MSALPHISTANARLPETYAAAKQALANCASIDECADWANKAEAMASYAKMAGDDTLRKMADRIQARAMRRCGELLKQYNGRGNNQHDKGELTKQDVAAAAGLSLHQQRQAGRVANVPADEFDQQVEGDNPPTVTKLAEQGKQTKPLVDLNGRDPEEFSASTQAQGALHRFAEFAAKTDPAAVARGAFPYEHAEIKRDITTIDRWLDVLITRLET